MLRPNKTKAALPDRQCSATTFNSIWPLPDGQKKINAEIYPLRVKGFIFYRRAAFNFCSQASTTHEEKLAEGLRAFSSTTLASISSMSSWGKRIPFFDDLLLVLPVAMGFSSKRCANTIHSKLRIKTVDVCAHIMIWCAHTFYSYKVLKPKPGSALTPTGPLTKPLIEVTIMADKQHTQIHPKYQYRYLALARADLCTKPFRLSIKAAGRVLAPNFIVAFAARLPVSGACHV